MHTTCFNPSLSYKASRSVYFKDPLLISSCCCCCCCATTTTTTTNNNNNLVYNSLCITNSSFLCNGLRQSTLIQFSPSKRLLVNYGRRIQFCDSGSFRFSSVSDSDKKVCLERRRLGGGRYACRSYEDKKNEQSFSKEVELLLDLLTEEVGLENVGVRDRKRVQKKDRSNVYGKTKTVNSGSVKRDTKDVEIRSSEKEIRKLRNKGRTFVKGGNYEGRKQGSSCSSYYSVASTGEYDSGDNDVVGERDGNFVRGESSSEYKDDRKMDIRSGVYDEEHVENMESRKEFGKRESEILKKNTAESYYGNQEWRKKSEKKLDVEFSQGQLTERNSQQHSEKTERITDQSQSGFKNKNFSTQKNYSDTENSIITSVQELTSHHKGETADFTRQNEYKTQSNVSLKASEIQNFDKRMESSSSSSFETRMKNWEENSAKDQREEKHQRVNQLTSSKESRVKTQQISNTTLLTNIENTSVSNTQSDIRTEKHQRVDQLTSSKESRVKTQQISDTLLTNIENTSVSNTQSDIRTDKQELHLESSSSSEKRKNIKDKYSTSQVATVVGSTESMKTGRKTTKAASFHVGMPKESSSSYKSLRLNPESSFQESDAHIGSAAEQQKSAGQFVGEFVEKAKHQLSISEGELVREDDENRVLKTSGENGSGNFDEKDGAPSDEMWHESGAPGNTSSDELAKRSGWSLWNVIGDVVRLRWGTSRSVTHTPKSGGVSNQSTGSERWFSGHEPDESSRKDVSTPSSSKGKQDSPLLLSSSNTNQGSSSNSMSPLVLQESSIPLPAIRMRRSPVVKKTSVTGETDASTSGKIDQIVPKPSTQVPLTDASGSGNLVIVDPPNPSRRKLARVGQLSSVTVEIDASTSGKIDQVVPKPSTQVPHTDASGSGKMVIVEPPIPSRRKLARIDQLSTDRFDEWEEAYTIESNQRKNDEFFMREALLEAKKGADLWEVPVGAVLVQDGKIIARGYNLVEELRDSTAHAEMVCIREASNKLHSWRLSGTTLYVTLEPCPMCAGAILQARIDTVVWGAPNKLLGADGSWIRLFPDGDGSGNGSDKPPAPVHPFHPNITVRRGILSSECADAMQQFFQLRRKKKDKKPEAESPSPPQPSCLPIAHHHNSKFVTKLHDAFSLMFCL